MNDFTVRNLSGTVIVKTMCPGYKYNFDKSSKPLSTTYLSNRN